MDAPLISTQALRSLGRALCHPLSLRGKALGPKLREKIILRVSSINRCPVCSAFHGVVARAEGLTPDEVKNARNPATDETLDEKSKLILQYAEIRTADLEADFPEVVDAFDTIFDEDVKREVRTIVDLFTFNNRFNNTWEALLPGAEKRRSTMGLTGSRKAGRKEPT